MRPVRICSVAALTGAGWGLEALWEAMVAARPLLAEHALGDPRLAGATFVAPPARESPERAIARVAQEAWRRAGLGAPARVAWLTGSSLGNMTHLESLHRSWWDPTGEAGPGLGSVPTGWRDWTAALYHGPTAVGTGDPDGVGAAGVGAAGVGAAGVGAAGVGAAGVGATAASGPAAPPGPVGPIAAPRTGGAWSLNTACSSAANAVGLAARWLRRGRIDAAVVVGYDVISPFVYAGFASLGAVDRAPTRPFGAHRRGLNLGEAAVALVLTTGEGPGPYVLGYGSSCDAHHLTRPDLSGGGLARAVRGALQQAQLPPQRVGFISAHGTGTPFNDTMEAAAFAQVFGADTCPPIHAAKPVTGHTLGAAGAVDLAVVAEALARGTLPPTYAPGPWDPALPVAPAREATPLPPKAVALSTSSGFGGSNCALVLGGAP